VVSVFQGYSQYGHSFQSVGLRMRKRFFSVEKLLRDYIFISPW